MKQFLTTGVSAGIYWTVTKKDPTIGLSSTNKIIIKKISKNKSIYWSFVRNKC